MRISRTSLTFRLLEGGVCVCAPPPVGKLSRPRSLRALQWRRRRLRRRWRQASAVAAVTVAATGDAAATTAAVAQTLALLYDRSPRVRGARRARGVHSWRRARRAARPHPPTQPLARCAIRDED